jgi:hypothetical protein
MIRTIAGLRTYLPNFIRDGLMDIGLYWSPAVLEHKLERIDLPGAVEEVWNCRTVSKGLGETEGGDRLFVASSKRWRGFFRLIPEVLYNPEDKRCPYTLIFDVKSWTPLKTSVRV